LFTCACEQAPDAQAHSRTLGNATKTRDKTHERQNGQASHEASSFVAVVVVVVVVVVAVDALLLYIYF